MQRACSPPSQRKTNAVINMGKRDKGILSSPALPKSPSPYLPSFHWITFCHVVSSSSSSVKSLVLFQWKGRDKKKRGEEEMREAICRYSRRASRDGDHWPLAMWSHSHGTADTITHDLLAHYPSNPLWTWTSGSASDKSHKIRAIKVVISFTWYGQFSLISSDWSLSHKGLKPLAQQFPCAAAHIWWNS